MFVLIVLPIVFILLFAFGVFPFSIAWIPVLLCGEISLAQLIKVIKQKDFMFNVYFYVWVFTIISAFIAPCINLYHNEWISYWPQPSKWTPYAFRVSLMYLVGIILWSFMLKDREGEPYKPSYRVLRPKWRWIILGVLLVSLMAQLYVYYLAGGIMGYMMQYTDETDFFEGKGLFFILSESFPYTFLIYAMLNRKQQLKQGQFFLLILVLFIVTMFFGGLKGSRSNTILFMVISVIALNIRLYKLKKSDIAVLLTGFLVFMYVGRLYKDYGVNMIYEEESSSIASTGMNSTELTIVGDLSRYSVNVYQLFLLKENPKHGINPFQKAYGKTYLHGFFAYVPGGKMIVHKFHLKSRSIYAAEMFFGSRSLRRNSRIFGPVGEWFINFGYGTFFIPYIVLGFMFRYFRNLTKQIPKDDLMFLVIPSFMTWLPQLVLSDTPNIMFFFMKRVVVVWLVLRLISKKDACLDYNQN